jgi:hypothetical protein
MTDPKERFARETKGSILYYGKSRLEKAKLLKIRSDWMQNFLELTPRAEEILSSKDGFLLGASLCPFLE